MTIISYLILILHRSDQGIQDKIDEIMKFIRGGHLFIRREKKKIII